MRTKDAKSIRVEAKLGWLRKFTPQVHQRSEMFQLAGITEHDVRQEGIHVAAPDGLADHLPTPTTPAAKRLRKDLREFVRGQSRQVQGDERLLGSSEVLESLIGKLKAVTGESGRLGSPGWS